ncbi:hypothetical protein [Bradyrhizobium sp. CB2312]|uniref:hypothetical protein n=1 Tax=Bradyrhizobium sp. CB2312 TaxID=3039155 RepID=UPI0032C227CA
MAKVARDALMRTLEVGHPEYGFADYKGYPVRAHYAALSRLGAYAAHRRSFGPVREVLGLPPCHLGLCHRSAPIPLKVRVFGAACWCHLTVFGLWTKLIS